MHGFFGETIELAGGAGLGWQWVDMDKGAAFQRPQVIVAAAFAW